MTVSLCGASTRGMARDRQMLAPGQLAPDSSDRLLKVEGLIPSSAASFASFSLQFDSRNIVSPFVDPVDETGSGFIPTIDASIRFDASGKERSLDS